MKTKLIKTDQEHKAALMRIEALMGRKAGTSNADELELLATLVDLFEKERFLIEAPDPIQAIRFRMEQAGLRQQDLVPYLGSRSRVSEILHGKRALTVEMIKALHQGLGIPLESLLPTKSKGDSAGSRTIPVGRRPQKAG